MCPAAIKRREVRNNSTPTAVNPLISAHLTRKPTYCAAFDALVAALAVRAVAGAPEARVWH